MFKVRLLLLTLLIGCGPVALPASELDPGATFAAHQVHNGFFIDRLRGGGTGIVEPARWISWPGSPQFRVRTEAATLGDLWLIAPARVEVRESAPPRTAGNVEPAWDNGRPPPRAIGGWTVTAADGLSQRLAAAQPGVHTRDYASLIRTPRPKAREARVPGHTIVVGAAFSGTLVAASHTQCNSVGSVSVNPRREPAAVGGQARRAERPSPSIHTLP